ncbi:MAG TPA: hypothetical protein DD979_15925 [Gammaproteobacteria bacterium]|nr:hypothetical protein [Gammaproteobacteria bacterium]
MKHRMFTKAAKHQAGKAARSTELVKAIAHALAGSSPALALAAAPIAVYAQNAVNTVSIPPGKLGTALNLFAEQSGAVVYFDASLTDGKTTPGLNGEYRVLEGLLQLLAGSGLQAVSESDGSFRIVNPVSDEDAMTLGPIRVESTAEARFGDAQAESGGYKAGFQTTATKLALSLRETPQALSVVTRDSMDARQANDIYTATELSAGVGDFGWWAPPGPFGGRGRETNLYSIRNQSVGTYGLRSDGFSIASTSTIDLAAYERVEVVKGPSGFYGQGSLGGFINLVRKKPQEAFTANISGHAGSYNTYRTEANITGALNQDKSLRGQLTAAYETEDSFVDEIGSDTTLFAPSIEKIINDRTRVLLQVLYQRDEYNVNYGNTVKVEDGRVVAFDTPRSYLFGIHGDEKSVDETIGANLKIDHELSDRWLASLLWQNNDSSRSVIQPGYGSCYAGYGFAILADARDVDSDHWAGELRLQGKFNALGREHQLVVGLQRNEWDELFANGYQYVDSYLYVDHPTDLDFASYDIVTRADIPFTFHRFTEQRNDAVYAQAVFELQDRTKLLINTRYDQLDQKRWQKGSDEVFENSVNASTYRIGLAHEFNSEISAYLTYGTSFDPVRAEGRDGQILDPIEGIGYEFGLKSEWFDEKLGATLAVYRQELDNRPITDPASLFANDGTRETCDMSAGLHRSDGIEMEIAGEPMPGLTVVAAANWSDNEYLDSDDPLKGKPEVGSADEQFSFLIHYEFQGEPLSGFGIGTTYVRLGDRRMASQWNDFRVDGYERVDLNLSYKGLPDWDFSLNVRNLFDKKYFERVRYTPGNGYFYGSPLSALFKATYHFD